MSGVVDSLGSLFGSEPYLLWLVVFAAAVCAVAGTMSVLSDREIRRRIKTSGGMSSSDVSALAFAEPTFNWLTGLEPLYGPFVPGRAEVAAEMRERLTHAGIRNPRAVEIFFAMRILIALGAGIVSIFVLPALYPQLKVMALLGAAVIAGTFGYLSPGYIVSWLASSRKQKVIDGFPDALDMMLVCVEAGLSLEGSVQRVGQEIQRAHPEIAQEFRLVGNEMLAGKTRHEALRSLAQRTGVDDVRGLVSLLIQADEFGTSVARALRIQASEMRTTRVLRAEERAHKIPVKLAFPLMFGLIPVVLIITLAPGIMRVIDVLMPLLSHSGLPTPHPHH